LLFVIGVASTALPEAVRRLVVNADDFGLPKRSILPTLCSTEGDRIRGRA
jgi:hypothetical protein